MPKIPDKSNFDCLLSKKSYFKNYLLNSKNDSYM